MSELKKALEKTGIDPDEIKGYFSEFDKDEVRPTRIALFHPTRIEPRPALARRGSRRGCSSRAAQRRRRATSAF